MLPLDRRNSKHIFVILPLEQSSGPYNFACSAQLWRARALRIVKNKFFRFYGFPNGVKQYRSTKHRNFPKIMHPCRKPWQNVSPEIHRTILKRKGCFESWQKFEISVYFLTFTRPGCTKSTQWCRIPKVNA